MNYPHGCLIGDHRNSLTTHNSTLKQYDAREAVKAPSGFFGASGHLVDRVMNPKTALGLWDAMGLVCVGGQNWDGHQCYQRPTCVVELNPRSCEL